MPTLSNAEKLELLLASIDMAREQGLKIPTVIEIAEWNIKHGLVAHHESYSDNHVG